MHMSPCYRNLVFVLLFPVLIHAGWKEWSEPQEINWGLNPSLAVDHNTGNVHITIMSSGVIYARVDSAGGSLFKEAVPNAQSDLGDWHFGASVAVDPSGNPHVAFRHPYGPNPYTVWSYDVLYTFKANGAWSDTLRLTTNRFRSYVVRLAVDRQYNVHLLHSAKGEDNKDYLKYFRIYDNQVVYRQDSIGAESGNYNFRIDDSFSLAASNTDDVHLVMGCPIFWEGGGPINYFKKGADENRFSFEAFLKSSYTNHRNGSPDLFPDTLNNTHFCYGSRVDMAINSNPSIRYLKYSNGQIVKSTPVNQAGELMWDEWEIGKGWGLGSIATSPDGQYIVIASLGTWGYEGGPLYCYYSSDYGETWQRSGVLANESGGFEGRDKPVIRAYKNNFYLIYSDRQSNKVYLRVMQNVGDEPPVAEMADAHTGTEGAAVHFDASASSDFGQNPGITEYAWDWENDGVFDEFTKTSQYSHVYADDFTGRAMLRITDRVGQTDTLSTSVVVTNVAPVLDIGPGMTGDEGEVLSFSATFSDPGINDTHTFSWNLGDGTTEDEAAFTHTYLDDDVYLVSCTISDNNGGTENATFNVTVRNVAPQVTIEGPAILEPGITGMYTAQVVDPGTNDVKNYAWDVDMDGQTDFTTASIDLNYTQKGIYPISVSVDDGDGGAGQDSLVIVISDGAPIILPVVNQTVEEGGAFNPVLLTEHVYDPETASENILWQVHGAQELGVSIQDHRLYVNIPDEEWYGEETLTLSAQNQQGLSDSVSVVYKVNYFNDPPVWTAKIPDFSIPEDSSITLTLDYLRNRVEDPDHALSALGFALTGPASFTWHIDTVNNLFVVQPARDWWGDAEIGFIVFDPRGKSDIDTSAVHVENIAEPPAPFALKSPIFMQQTSWPDTLVFSWGGSYDPDNRGFLYYTWTLEKQNDPLNLHKRVQSLSDTLYKLPYDDKLAFGTYTWRVEAFDASGDSRESSNIGIIAILTTGLSGETRVIPESFKLLPNYPNPFNHSTSITYHIPKACDARCVVFNLMGQRIKTLSSGHHAPGVYQLNWDGTNMREQAVESGIYIIRFISSAVSFERKIMLLK